MSEEVGFCCDVEPGRGGGGIADALCGLFAAGKDGTCDFGTGALSWSSWSSELRENEGTGPTGLVAEALGVLSASGTSSSSSWTEAFALAFNGSTCVVDFALSALSSSSLLDFGHSHNGKYFCIMPGGCLQTRKTRVRTRSTRLQAAMSSITDRPSSSNDSICSIVMLRD